MNPEKWSRLKELFGSAVERAPGERDAYLREACGGDEELRAELEALLSSHDSEQSRVEPSPGPAIPSVEPAGKRIGPYQVIRQIGTGGMGAVYLAARADETYSKQVAIKVVQAGIGTQDILQRFRHERQILATLDHPNIARLLDGGATEDGLPYFAMDYVEGARIDEYCAAHNLPVAERVRLFRQVCAAVQYVHQNLVVHRDLKPGNILVTADGVAKLLDFGIAKLLKPEMFGDLTRADLRPMTPGYASPEQVRGEPVTTASDVYSLGVILYELLTSRSPYRLKGDSPSEMLLAVSQQEPEKPSAAVAAEKLTKQLRGDLDNIVLKALRKEPQRRYASAEQLSEDLRRYLTGLPVLAHQDSWSYRAGKFVGRHRAGVAAAALVAISLAGGILAATWQARVAGRERANAQRQFNDVRKLATSFLFEFHNAIQNLPGSTPARKLLVQRALEYLHKLAQEAHGDAGLERELAEAYLKVGDVQGNPEVANLGDAEGAVQSYRNALRISQALSAADPKDAAARRYLARSYRSLGEVLPVLGQPSEGLASMRHAIQILEELCAADPRDEALRAELAGTYQEQGDLEGHSGLQNLGDPAAALSSYQKGLAIFRKLAGRNARRGEAILRVRIADLEMERGDLKGASNAYREALAALEALAAADPTNADTGLLVALGYRKAGGALEELGNFKEALAYYAKAAAVNERLANADPGNVRSGMALAITLRYTGDLLSRTGDRAGAVSRYERVLRILEKLSAVQPDNVLVEQRRSEMLIVLAGELDRDGRREEARRMSSGALAITRKLAAREDVTPEELSTYAANFLTCVPAGLREPATAVEYAGRAVEQSGGKDASALDLLARAIKAEKQALGLLPASSSARRERESRIARFEALTGRHSADSRWHPPPTGSRGSPGNHNR